MTERALRAVDPAWLDQPVRERRPNSPVIFDTFALMCLPLERVFVPGTYYPLNDVMLALLVVVAAFRPPRRARPAIDWFTFTLVGIVLMMTFSQITNGLSISLTGWFQVDGWRRIFHVITLVMLAHFLATERIEKKSAITGISFGVLGAGILAIFKIGGDDYPGRLTGFFGDPNVAGAILTALGPALITYAATKARGFWIGVVITGLVVLTYSRTALLAWVLVIVWRTIGAVVSRVPAILLMGGLTLGVMRIPEEWALQGPFSGREGSDLLRERIDEAAALMAQQAPWYGYGPGKANVLLNGTFFQFHNSYYATIVEGGWVLLALAIGLIAMLFISLTGLPRSQRAPWLEGSMIALMVSAQHLGEVFLANFGFMAIGIALMHYAHSVAQKAEVDPDDPLAAIRRL